MRCIASLCLGLCLLALTCLPTHAAGPKPVVVLDTSLGQVWVMLDPDAAPATVANFLAYVEAGSYDGTVFHRVIPGFMAQGGGFDMAMVRRDTRAPVMNEADNGLRNARGTIAMARTGDPHSATSQFFINLKDNAFLDHTSKTPQGWGYCVFGKVVRGMDVVDSMAAVPTTSKGMMQDVPSTPIVIQRASIHEGQ